MVWGWLVLIAPTTESRLRNLTKEERTDLESIDVPACLPLYQDERKKDNAALISLCRDMVFSNPPFPDMSNRSSFFEAHPTPVIA